jgi:hypothetical protein
MNAQSNQAHSSEFERLTKRRYSRYVVWIDPLATVCRWRHFFLFPLFLTGLTVGPGALFSVESIFTLSVCLKIGNQQHFG